MNADLAIALPTYNRSRFLDAALSRLIPEVAPYGIEIFVSDNKSTDDTAAIVARHAESYPLLTYSCNTQNLGMDGNFEAALRHGASRYVWLLGDTYAIETAALHRVMTALETKQNFDAIVVDVEQRAADIPGQVYTDRTTLLAELGWHMTCMSAMILSRDLIQTGAFARYHNTLFIHVGVIFDYLAMRKPLVLWVSGCGATTLRLAGESKVSWESRWFDVWVDNWIACILSLPAVYSVQAKLLCIVRHGQRSGVFSIATLTRLRSGGVLSPTTIMGRWTALRLATGQRRWLLLACALAPTPVARLAVNIRTRWA